MRVLRLAWHPLTSPVLVAVVLPLATLAGPEELRPGWLFLLFLVGSPAAAVASVMALRSALARIAVPTTAPAPSQQEAVLRRSLCWLLVLVSVLGPLTLWAAAAGVAPGALASHQAAILSVLPLFFAVLGARLWRDLASARRRRAQGLEPLVFERATWTGDAGLDALLGRKPRTTARLVWIIGFVSALAFLSPGHAILAQLAKANAAVAQGELWRLCTASLVHGDLAGLAVSALAFFAVAPLVEVLIGPRWLVAVLLAGGAAATAASFAFVSADYMGTTGADAALTGLVLAFAVRHRRRLPPAVARRVALHGLVALAMVVVGGVLLTFADNAAHLGGLAFGTLAGLLAAASPATRAALEKARGEALRQS